MNLAYVKNLDALRAFAALGVIIAHAYSVEIFPSLPSLATVAYFGNFGVSLFFVLSGFVITRILIRTHQDEHYFRTFYIRRMLRIFPLYYAGLLVYYFLPFVLGWSDDLVPFNQQAIYYAYLQNFSRTFDWGAAGPGHYWSLAVEEHFYLLWPGVVYVALRANPKMLLYTGIAIVVLVHVLRAGMLNAGYDINVFTFTRLDQLVYGGLIAVAEYYGLVNGKNQRWFVLIMILGCLFILILEFGSPEMRELFKYTAFGLAFTGLIFAVSASPDSGTLSKLLQLGWLQYLGKISYGLYVWHVLAMMLVTNYVKGPAALSFLLVILSTIFIAAFSFAFLESPFLRLKGRFNY